MTPEKKNFMSQTKRYFLLLFLIISFSSYYYFDWHLLYKKNEIYIALACPMSGKYSSIGMSMFQGASLFIENINQAGGIDGKKIVLETYDDKNDPEQAKAVALQIANANKYIAVIGHFLSDCSVSAGDIYKKNQIPVITPTSSNPMVTKDNEWYFRNVHKNSLQSSYLASYIQKEFSGENVSIIYENTNYGKNSAKVFEKSTTDLGIEVKYKWKLDPTEDRFNDKLRRMAFDIQMKNDAGILFIASYADTGIKIIKIIKDNLIKNRIMATASLASETFQRGITTLKKEKNNPGFYTNGLIVAIPIINDTINEKGQIFNHHYRLKFGSKPGWHAALTYETTMLISNALKNSGAKCLPETLNQDRKKIQEYLLSKNSATNAVEGITGPIFFNKDRDAQKPLFTGIYKKQYIISTSYQYQPIHNIFEISDFNESLQQKKIVLLNGQFMHKITIVYTGIDLIEIYDVDFKSATFSVRFNLWFRFKGKINPDNILFINSSGDVQIEPIKKIIKNDVKYSIYRVDGKFKMDFLPKKHAFNEHILGVSFQHIELTRDNLIYVADLLSLGSKGDDKIIERMQKAHILNPALGWGIEDGYFFQSTSKCSPNGEPKYLLNIDGLVKYSKYNVGIRINKKEFAFRDIIPDEYFRHMLVFSIFFLICVSYVISEEIFICYSRSIWFLQAVFSFCILISLESILDMNVSNHFEAFQISVLNKVINIFWWIVPSVLICLAIKRFIWKPLEIKTGQIIPDIIVSCTSFVVYLLTFFGIIAFVFDQKITSLLATSGVFAMIIGLAVQINISNFFSGIAINIETPFKIGDWVKIGDQETGKVLDITWRTTRLQTIDDSIVSIPNSMVSESLIHNYHYPTNVFRSWFTLHIDTDIPPEKVKEILIQSLAKIDCICDNPSPSCYFKGLSEWSAKYLVSFSIKDYSNRLRIVEAVWTEVWHNLRKEDVTLALLRKDFYVGQELIDLSTLKR
jgi:branched-chain amino acid transport system substrate-binding protein